MASHCDMAVKLRCHPDRMTTVALVDDDPGIRDALGAAMSTLGYDVVLGRNGRDALELAAEGMAGVMVLDLMMPVMDGFEACRRIRSLPAREHQTLPIIMLTALSDPMVIVAGLRCGADAYAAYRRVSTLRFGSSICRGNQEAGSAPEVPVA